MMCESFSEPTAKGYAMHWIPIVLAFPVVGVLVGWLVGASNSPAVGALLPLVFGLFGAMGFGALEKRTRREWLKSVLDGMKLEKADQVRLQSEKLPETSLKTPAMWSSGVILFCVACFFGVRIGIDVRVPSYKPLSELVALDILTVEEQSLLHRLRWHLLTESVAAEDAEAFFATTIATALMEKEPLARYEKLSQIVENVAGSSIRGNRGISSEPPIPPVIGQLPW